jgi:hypothetical protein
MIEIKWFHPFNVMFYKKPKIDWEWHPINVKKWLMGGIE